MVVHLSGALTGVESELDGRIAPIGCALPDEIWFIPSSTRYATVGTANRVRFAEITIKQSSLDPIRHGAMMVGLNDPLLARLAVAASRDDYGAGEALIDRLQSRLSGTLSDGSLVQRLKPSATRRIATLLDADHLARISVRQLAACAAMSVNRFILAFTATFGSTPGRFLAARRLRLARHALLHSDCEVGTIALTLGYCSHAHLTTAFSDAFGQSPSAWRQSAKSRPTL